MNDTNGLHDRLTRAFSTVLHVEVPSIDADLFETGVLDSLAFVELLLHLEREFGVTPSSDELQFENFKSIARIAEFVTARRHPDHRPSIALEQ
jgi:acyl carrier protein